MKYGKWTVVGEKFRKDKTHYYIPCKCECGLKKDVAVHALKSGRSRACVECASTKGNTKHGLSGTPIYKRWEAMNTRCRSNKIYKARGTKVEWNTFEEFYADMNDSFDVSLELDRIDNNGNYSKENCRWVSCEVNVANRSNHSRYGVGIYKSGNGYSARLTVDNRLAFNRTFKTIELATEARNNFIMVNNLKHPTQEVRICQDI